MQLTFKTLKKKVFKVDIDSEKSVGYLKSKIEKEYGSEYPADRLKLILKGKVLSDEQIINTLLYAEKSQILLMIVRDMKHSDTNNCHNSKKPDSTLKHVSKSESKQTLANLAESVEIEDGDATATVEFFINLPEDGDLDGIMNILKEHMQTDPNIVKCVVEEDYSDSDMSSILPNMEFDQNLSDDSIESDDSMSSNGNGTQEILTQNDLDNIERISSMGFNKERVIEAYLASGKNMEAAVTFLLNK